MVALRRDRMVGRGVPPSRMVGTAFHRRPPRPPRDKSARQPLTVDGEQLCRRLEPHGRAHACALVCLEGVVEDLARRVIPQRRRKDHAVVLVKGNEMFLERGGVGRGKAKRVVGGERLLPVFRHDETCPQRGGHVQSRETARVVEIGKDKSREDPPVAHRQVPVERVLAFL